MLDKQVAADFFQNEEDQQEVEVPAQVDEPEEDPNDDTDLFEEEEMDADNESLEAPEYEDDGEAEEAAEQSETAEEWQSKFKSPQEMYEAYQKIQKSYDHLRPKFTQVTQELSSLKRASEEPDQSQQQQQPYEQQMPQQPYGYPQQSAPSQQFLGYPPGYDPYSVAASANPYGQQQPHMQQSMGQARQPQQRTGQSNEEFVQMKRQMETMQIQQELSALASNPDFNDLAPAMVEAFKQNPKLWEMPNPVETAYNMVKGKTADQRTKDAAKKGRDSAYQKRETKKDVSSKSRTGKQAPSKAPDEMIAESIVGMASRKNKSIF